MIYLRKWDSRRKEGSKQLSHQYGICDRISEEISGLKDRRRVLEKELHDLKKKEKQSKWCKKGVKLRSNSESSSGSSITGSMKQVDSNDSEDLQFLTPSSSSETPTSRSLAFSQAATDSAQVGMPSLFDTEISLILQRLQLLHQFPRIRSLPHHNLVLALKLHP